jgi:RelA/SpoT family (p)ppGpp synthetase
METLRAEDPYLGQLQRIKLSILEHFPRDKTPKIGLLEQAFQDAEYYHRGQFRKSGEPVIIHPYRVALLATEAGLDADSVIVALLHDLIEDTEVTKDALRERYGEWLAEVVDGLTKAPKPGNGKPPQGGAGLATYRKLLFSTIKDIRTLLVKIFDRLDNMRDLSHLDRRRQRRISTETYQVYVPFAQRMGLFEIADELTTLCFRFLYPKRFKKVLEEMKARVAAEQPKVSEIRTILETSLGGLEFVFHRVEPRYHSVSEAILEKQMPGRALKMFKITVPQPRDCYLAMGALHMTCRAVPNSIRDYISNPKPNRYQGLESQIFVGEEVVAIAIASLDMELVNRRGILAQWKGSYEELSRYYQTYLELIDQLDGDEDLRMEDVLRYAQMEALQAFTPKGDRLNLPQGSTVLDFAYAIHSDLGNRCDGALIGGRRVSRFAELKDGDMVSVLTSERVEPTPDWLERVRTTKARINLRRLLRGLSLQRAQELGGELLAAELTRLGEDPKRLLGRPEFYEALKQRKLTLPQFFQQMGTRKLNLRPFLTEHGLISTKKVQRRESWERSVLTRYLAPLFRAPDPDVKVGRSGDAFIQMAGCCVPLYGDPIAGVQKEHGITIHRLGCAMLAHADPAQRITVGWDVDAGKSAHRIAVTAADKSGVIYQIGKIMHSLGVSIHEITTNRDTTAGLATISLNIEPVTSKTFQKIVARLRGLKEVKTVQ